MITDVDLRTLPISIQIAIRDLEQAVADKNQLAINDEVCEVYGAINGSQHGDEISKELADFLRAKYLGI